MPATDPNDLDIMPDNADDLPDDRPPRQDPSALQAELAAVREELAAIRAERTSRPANPLTPPPAPAAPPPPDFKFYTADDIQSAYEEGDFKKVAIMTDHNTRTATKQSLYEYHQKEVAPALNLGGRTLSDLSARVLRSEMPHLDIPEVAAEYQQMSATLLAQGQNLDTNAQQEVYKWVCGRNLDKIIAKTTKASAPAPNDDDEPTSPPPSVQLPSQRTSRSASKGKDVIPPPEQYFDAQALELLRRAGRTPDQEAQRKGYADYRDWYTRVVMKKKR